MQHTLKHPCNAPATLAVVRLRSLLALAALLALSPVSAAPRPLIWRADFPSAQVATFPVRHGTDVEFRPSWHINGVPANTNGEWTLSLSVQTNGAPAGEWAIIPGSVFSHTNDCGADAYNVLVRAVDRDGTVDYSAAARLRMLPSPGFSPGALPPAATFQESDPVFSAWRATFQESDPVFSSWLSTFTIPETSLEPSTNYTDRSLSAFAATGTVFRAASYGTPTRWTDATGCVWSVSDMWSFQNGFLLYTQTGPNSWVASGTERDSDYSVYYGYGFWYDTSNGRWVAHTDLPEDPDVSAAGLPTDTVVSIDSWGTFRRIAHTNLIGRVALTNDIPSTAGFATPQTVTNTVRSLSLGGIWDGEVWWTPVMLPNGCLTYQATTNVNMEANQ